LIDLHTHHARCGHATGTLEHYIESALSLGLTTIGVSDHSPLFGALEDEAAPGMHMARSEFGRYVAEALALKEKYRGRIEVLVGVEADYLPGTEALYDDILRRYDLDYVLGAVHYFGGYHVYDPARWKNVSDVNEVYREYLRLVRQAAQTGIFDILAHIDAVKGRGLPPTEDLSADIEETVRVIKAADVAVEINTSGLRKCGEPFPAPAVIRRLHEAGVPLTFGSDAHSPSEVHHGWREVAPLLSELGVDRLVLYRQRQRFERMAGLSPSHHRNPL
jgi:histidinol-phosphatase (PHP family)